MEGMGQDYLYTQAPKLTHTHIACPAGVAGRDDLSYIVNGEKNSL